MIIGRDLINKYYEDEKLYSTGDDYLDEMLEKAFCEGYEYAQKEFAMPIPKGAFNPKGIANMKTHLVNNGLKPTAGNMKQLMTREMQGVKSMSPTRFAKTPKRLSGSDISTMKKYFPKTV